MQNASRYTIQRRELLRYLGAAGIREEGTLAPVIDAAISEALQLATPRVVSQEFSCILEPDGVRIPSEDLFFPGEDFLRHMQGASAMIVMAATLGIELERRIARYAATDLLRAAVLDAAATTLIEEVCDRYCEDLLQHYEKRGQSLTSRFSCGYGDLPITLQGKILSAVGAEKKIGLCVTEDCILTPRKSVTAMMGIIPAGGKTTNDKSCKSCSLFKTCQFRKDGVRCGR